MAHKPLGSAVRTVKRRNDSSLVAKPVNPPGSELLEKVDPAEVSNDIEFTGPVQESKPPRRKSRKAAPAPAQSQPAGTPAVAFVRRHYRNGRHAADVARAWVPYTLAIAALCTAGFLEGLVTAATMGLLGLVLVGFGFLSGLVSRWRQRNQNKPNTDGAIEEESSTQPE